MSHEAKGEYKMINTATKNILQSACFKFSCVFAFPLMPHGSSLMAFLSFKIVHGKT